MARRLFVSADADELFVTQTAINRQIKALAPDARAALFLRGTRKVAIPGAGELLRQAVLPALDGLGRARR